MNPRRTQTDPVATENSSALTTTPADGCTTGCTSEAEIPYGGPSTVPLPVAVGTPLPSDFAAALAMIATLPLSDAERAEAVRRLLGDATRSP
ncbi:MAG: hypothetical protein SH850_22355 [Planctomycetaceae bacterium]|nr:hypothetical protein [Planctomycetaceae bacterium]